MQTILLNSKLGVAMTKVIAMASKWADDRKAVQRAQDAPAEQQASLVGRYEASGKALAQAVEKYHVVERETH